MRLFVALLAVVVLAGCFATRGAVSHYVNADHDLSLYRSWEWDAPSGPAEPELDRQIRSAIESELRARGYHRVDGQWPELRVSYALGLHREIELHTERAPMQLVSSMNQSASFQVGISTQRARVYETGTLILRVDRPAEAKSSWWAVQSIRTRISYAREASQSVATIFQTFPTRSTARIPTETTELEVSPEQLAVAP